MGCGGKDEEKEAVAVTEENIREACEEVMTIRSWRKDRDEEEKTISRQKLTMQ